MEFPQVFVFDGQDESDVAAKIEARLPHLGVEEPLVIASSHGLPLAQRLSLTGPVVTPPEGAERDWASGLGSKAVRSGAGSVLAIGGGRCLDLAKLVAARAGLTIATVPTQLSHDGICSPVAVVPNSVGRTESVGAVAPKVVLLSMPTIAAAPDASFRAGIGDLLANPLALKDWTLAAERGLSTVVHRAWDLSVESFERIRKYLDKDLAVSRRERSFPGDLADALILSGMAMIAAGTSRPASGGEHEISHAIDMLYGNRAMHGEQVAFSCIFSVALYGDDVQAFRSRLRTLGLPDHPGALDLSRDDLVRVLITAPDTRPGRFTIVESADLDQDSSTALIEKIWGSELG